MKLRNHRGASAVEFAILLPVLCLIVFGIIEFGFILYDKAVVTNASREGARFGIVAGTPRKTDGEIETVVENYCNGILIPANTVNTDVDTPDGQDFGDRLIVTVTYHYNPFFLPSWISSFIGGKDLTGQTIMLYE